MSLNLRSVVFVFCLAIITLPVFSIGDGDKKKGESDTVSYKVSEELLEDSLLYFPANELYSQWNTSDIHPYKFDLPKTIDTVLINLNDPNYCGYHHPVNGVVNSDFGFRKHRFHYGIDIDLETGDPVKSAFEGKVRIAQYSKTYGNVVVIRHNNGLETLYAHLSKIEVSVDQDVDAGEEIALGGNTGRSSGSHLHFEVRYLGAPINPHDVISFNECTLASNTLMLTKNNFKYLNEVHKTKYYTVRKGDTLSKIARKKGISISTLCKLNRISKKTKLRVGQKLRY